MIVTPANSPGYYNSTNRLDTSNLYNRAQAQTQPQTQTQTQAQAQGQTAPVRNAQTSSVSQVPAYTSSVSADTMAKFNAYDSNGDGVMSVLEFSAYTPSSGCCCAGSVPSGHPSSGNYYNTYG